MPGSRVLYLLVAAAQVQIENRVDEHMFGQNLQISGAGKISKERGVLSETREQLGSGELKGDLAPLPERIGCVEMRYRARWRIFSENYQVARRIEHLIERQWQNQLL